MRGRAVAGGIGRCSISRRRSIAWRLAPAAKAQGICQPAQARGVTISGFRNIAVRARQSATTRTTTRSPCMQSKSLDCHWMTPHRVPQSAPSCVLTHWPRRRSSDGTNGRSDGTFRQGGVALISSVIGGAMLPHAPQFFTMPETEDRDTVERVKTVAAEIGTRLRALRPDLWIIFANDHVEQFFHTAAPPFTIHVGAEAKGEFAGRQFHWRVPGEIGFEIVRQMYAQGFDPAFTSVAKIDYALGIPLTHLEIADPVLPIYVNAYLPPPPSMERCYAFGQALARIVSAMGVNTVVLASGGMSHYPGTERYAAPDF